MSAHLAGWKPSASAYNHGCRCTDCREKHRSAMADYRRRRSGMGAYEHARLMAVAWVREHRPDLWAGMLEQANEDIKNAAEVALPQPRQADPLRPGGLLDASLAAESPDASSAARPLALRVGDELPDGAA